MLQGGDFETGQGYGGYSPTHNNDKFDDENFIKNMIDQVYYPWPMLVQILMDLNFHYYCPMPLVGW